MKNEPTRVNMKLYMAQKMAKTSFTSRVRRDRSRGERKIDETEELVVRLKSYRQGKG